MKRIIVLFVLTSLLLSCNKEKTKPILDYEATSYFSKNDWKVTEGKKDTLYQMDKKIMVIKDFISATDSVSISTQFSGKNDLKLYPKGEKLATMIHSALLDCKYACSNPATFKPQSITFYSKFGDTNDFNINIKFLASNTYGTPGELQGFFNYDGKTFKSKDQSIF